MHASVGHQSDEMHFLAGRFGIVQRVDQHGFFGQRAVFHGQVYFHQILIYHAARAQIGVAHFGVTHLSIG